MIAKIKCSYRKTWFNCKKRSWKTVSDSFPSATKSFAIARYHEHYSWTTFFIQHQPIKAIRFYCFVMFLWSMFKHFMTCSVRFCDTRFWTSQVFSWVHFRLLVPWVTRLLSQWMLRWWINSSTARKPFSCTHPVRGKTSQIYRFRCKTSQIYRFQVLV